MDSGRDRVVTTLAVVMLAAGIAGAQPGWRQEIVIDGDPVMRGLPKDAIPAIDRPTFVPADQATFVHPEEPVIGLVVNGEARAYPTWLLNGHEIVNDRIGSRAIAVTW